MESSLSLSEAAEVEVPGESMRVNVISAALRSWERRNFPRSFENSPILNEPLSSLFFELADFTFRASLFSVESRFMRRLEVRPWGQDLAQDLHILIFFLALIGWKLMRSDPTGASTSSAFIVSLEGAQMGSPVVKEVRPEWP